MLDGVFTMLPGEHGVIILKHRYNLITKFILAILEEEGPSSSSYVKYLISDKLFAMFDGEVLHYVDIILRDLEDRQIIERFPNSRAHKIRIKREYF